MNTEESASIESFTEQAEYKSYANPETERNVR